jgi:hypothetical protein
MRVLLVLAAVLLAGCPASGAEDPPAADPAGADPDQAFRALADRVAARTESHVVAWGEAPLAADARPRRFAVLEPDEPMHGRGAYLVEDRPGRVWRISFRVDGRTLIWGLEPGAPIDADPSWRQIDDRAVEHEQGHHRGGERIELALRKGRPVVLVYEYTGDADTEVTERSRFARDGVCVEPCPPVDGFTTEDADLRVTRE